MSLLKILTPAEKRKFELPPKLTNEDRAVLFTLTPAIKRYVSKMENNKTRAIFLLQLAYFRASARFYKVDVFWKRDIQHVKGLLNARSLTLSQYNSTTNSKHRRKILNYLEWTNITAAGKELLESYASRQAINQVKPREVFIGLIELCWKHRFSIPSYFDLAEIVTNTFNRAESDMLKNIATNISDDQRDKLEDILACGNKVSTRKQPLITELKKINQGLKPGQIKESVDTIHIFKALFEQQEAALKAINLQEPAARYLAGWFDRADFQQLTQFPDRNKCYLHLLAFIQHQYYLRQDSLVDILLKSVNSMLRGVTSKLSKKEQTTKKERNEALQALNNSHKSMKAFAKSVISIVELNNIPPNEKYSRIEALVKEMEELSNSDEGKIASLDNYLALESRNQNFYTVLEEQSNKIQRRVSGIIKALDFDRGSSCSDLLSAIDYFNAKDGRITDNAPLDFLSTKEQEIVFREGSIIAPLYKVLLFIQIAKGIKSGKLNLLHSYRYKAIQNYLIDKTYWENNKEAILRAAGLEAFADGQAYLDGLAIKLNDKFHSVNKRILKKDNEFFKLNAQGKPIVQTPGIDIEHQEYISAVLSQEGYTPILKVLKEINAATDFTKCLKHFSTKNVKMKPNEETLLAGLIGKGCNIGIAKLANISTGVSESVLGNAVNWCFDMKNIQASNQKVLEAIRGLSLANNYLNNPNILHSSSDGRKLSVAVDCLHANYSFKYFGREKGVSMYTFVDERQSIYYSTVFSASDREAAYVIDGLMMNDVPQNQIHSTDTHGYTEQIFCATHFMGVDFAPRIKSLHKQSLYGFSSRKTYKNLGYPIIPSRTIDRKLILRNWDDILRFMATIKTNHTSASQLFKRLSSYANTHPLYKALKEFGRIIKSQFALTYYDDVELRQQIQKQLNRVEQTNKFAHAVFFDNDQAFQDGSLEGQKLSTACQVLLQNCIILWNYMYLSDQIMKTKDKTQKAEMIEAIGLGSVIAWGHVNMRGEYNFTRRAANDPQFDFNKIKALKL